MDGPVKLLAEDARPAYILLAEGLFRKPDVELCYDPARYTRLLSPDANRLIDEQWHEALVQSRLHERSLYNSPLFRLGQVRSGGNTSSLGLGIGNTDYREYLASRTQAHEVLRADPLGTAVIVLTSDGAIPIAKRSNRVEANAGRYFTFGGFFDRQIDWEIGEHRPSLFGCARRELKEELGIEVGDDDLRLIGVVYDRRHPHPEACFLAPVDRAAAELLGNWDTDEISDLILVPLAGLAAFLDQESSRICEGLRGGFEIFLRLLAEETCFGEEARWSGIRGKGSMSH